MKKLLIATASTLISLTSYGAVIPLVDVNNCAELANKALPPTTCNMFLFSNPTVMVNQGDTFNISCTFSAGNNNSGGIIPGDVIAMVVDPSRITSGPAIPTDQATPIKTQGSSSVRYSWTGVADAQTPGTFFGISFNPPSTLRNDQTIKVSCVNN